MNIVEFGFSAVTKDKDAYKIVYFIKLDEEEYRAEKSFTAENFRVILDMMLSNCKKDLINFLSGLETQSQDVSLIQNDSPKTEQ